jgi:WD40 repeat protein
VGDDHYVDTLSFTVSKLLGVSNLVVVRTCPDHPLIAVGSSDRTMSIVDIAGTIKAPREGEANSSPMPSILRKYQLDAALLSIDWDKSTDLIICSTMNAKLYLIDWQCEKPLCVFDDHTKLLSFLSLCFLLMQVRCLCSVQ